MSPINPLILPEILGTVFKFLGIQELLKCRKVCRLWDLETSPLIGERKLICLNDTNKLRELYDLINSNQLVEIETGNKLIFPFRAFEFWSFRIDLDQEAISRQISTCGPYFHHLTLNFDKDSENLINIRTLRDLFLYYLPNLKSLSLRQLPSTILAQNSVFPPEGHFVQPILSCLKTLTVYSDGDYNTNFLSDILGATAHLKHIHVEYGDEPKNFKSTILSAIFSSCNRLSELESLQYFLHDPGSGCNWAWTPEETTKLAECGFPLTSIKLHPAGQFGTGTMYNLLTTLKFSLTSLKLRVHDELRCPLMSCLTTLVIFDYEGSLLFLDNLPNLRSLGLCEYSPAKSLTPENIVPKKRHQGVLSLNFYGSYTLSNHLFRAIAKTFSCLKILNFWHINNEKLQTVIENFPLLEELTINAVCVDDEAFTGFPIQLCEQMERLGNYSEDIVKQSGNNSRNPIETRPRMLPYIGDLSNLRRLEIHGACLADWKWSNFSDVSIYFGLMQLTNLTSLSLYELKWITDTAILQLCKTLPLLYLKLDSRAFPENLMSDIENLCPRITLENVTDEFESYNTFYISTR